MYLPFVSLLGLQAALSPFTTKAKQEPISTNAVPFVNPTVHGGSMLDSTTDGLGEPLNVIISGYSSPWILGDGGFVFFANAIGFGIECFGAHLGDPQSANLGDGNGYVNQTLELRQDYGNPDIGTCWESLVGGNHLRLFRQNGPSANTGALFLAVSQEENVTEGHNITPDGYNIGRDKLVQSAVNLKSYKGVKFQVTSQTFTGLLPPGSTGVNHGIATDGVTVLLTVLVVSK
jgi:hypothetical protein